VGCRFFTGLESDIQPSRQIAASLLDRNKFAHTMGSEIRFLRMIDVNLSWLT